MAECDERNALVASACSASYRPVHLPMHLEGCGLVGGSVHQNGICSYRPGPQLTRLDGTSCTHSARSAHGRHAWHHTLLGLEAAVGVGAPAENRAPAASDMARHALNAGSMGYKLRPGESNTVDACKASLHARTIRRETLIRPTRAAPCMRLHTVQPAMQHAPTTSCVLSTS